MEFNKMSNSQANNSTTASHSNGTQIPVSVHSNGKKYIIPVDTSRPIQSVTESIQQIEKIPPQNQLLLYQGHVLNGNSTVQQLQPHDHVEIIVKAKGGMLHEGVDATAESGPEPTKNSTEDEVTKWLKDIVRVQEETLTQCCEVDGEMLFRYNRDEYKTFAEDFDITIGQALRIIVVRDGSCYKHADTKVAGWTIADVSSFIMGILKSKESAEVCQFFKTNMIDGLVLCQYDSDLNLYQDFPGIGIRKGIIKKIFTKLANLPADNKLDEKYVSCNNASQTVYPREVFQNKDVKELESSVVIPLSSGEQSPRTHDYTSTENGETNTETDVATSNAEDEYISSCTTLDTLDRPFGVEEISKVKRETGCIHVLDDPTKTNNINNPTLTQVDADIKQTSKAGKAKQNILSGTTSSITEDQCTKESEHPDSVIETISTDTREFFTFIEKTLHLRSCRPSATKTCCPLNLCVFTYNSSRLNELQKQLLFFVLLRDKDLPTAESQKIFWHQIAKEPMLWVNRVLTPSEKNMIKPTKSEGKLKINGKECSLIGLQVTIKRVMDKCLTDLLAFNNHILLVHRHALEKDTIGYVVKLQSHRRKSIATYNFKFFHEKKYILFDLEDFSYGFTDSSIDSCKQGSLQPWEGSVSLQPEDVHDFVKNSSEMKHNMIVSSNNVHTKIPFESETKQQQNDSNLLALTDLQTEKFIDLSNTSDKQNMTKAAMPVHEFEHQTASNLSEQNRYFGKSSYNIVYREGRTLVELENNDSLSKRCISYQHFHKEFNPQDDELMSDMMFRTLTFACACLNSRRNGTIYFGVGTEDGVRRNEVSGITLNFEQDRQVIADHVWCCINKHFPDPLSNVTNQCISPPHFIQVVQNEASVARFVMEFDIEPKSSVCKDMFFKMSWPILHEKNVKRSCAYGYVFDGLETKQISGNDEKLFILTDLKEKIKERHKKEEFKSRENKMSESAFSKLQRRLLGGQDKIIPSVWYSLVLTCPTVQQKNDIDWKSCFNFIKRLPITAVFDFDDESNVNGLCSYLRNCEKTQLQSWSIFEQYAGSYEKLQSILNVPYSDGNIWVFCNGRSDSDKKYPHLKRDEWMLEYSTGISQAVHFLKASIPRKRLYVIILLLSNDLEGVIDTFVDFIGRFGWEYVLLIAEEEKIFDEFCKAILLERKGTREQLEEISLVGLPWAQVNAAMNEISGRNEYGNCYIPASSGGTIPLEEKFLESLNDLEILSATQCENKEFKDDKKRREFAHKMELEFYRGNKVTWWNYFFNTHVLERDCFQKLHDTINNHLFVKHHDTCTKVATVMITYEPGAGGSTLGRHLLWAFRKKFRCAVVKKITDRTYSNIMFLHQYKEDTFNAKPVILLVDEVPQSDLFFYELENSINTKNRTVSNHNQLICCMIVLQRDEHLDDLSNQPSMYTNACVNKQFQNLRQKCFQKEIDWLKDKYCELEETGKDLGMDFKPEHFISFMILRQNFNDKYVKNTVHSLMESTPMSNAECLLLKYASLISAFMPFSRLGFKTYIPLECCDAIMTVNSPTTSNYYWERHLSHTTRIFLVTEKKENASGMQVRVAHAILAKAVLREFIEVEDKSLGKIVEEFLECSLFDSSTHGRKDLIEMTKEMLKRRLKEEYDDEVNTSFSPLIEEILEHSSGSKTQSAVASAVAVLRKGFEKFNDPMIAQSLARLHTKHEQFEEAIKYAEKAIELSPRVGRLYCMHTLGYVLKTKFTMDTHECGKLSPRDAKTNLDVIFRALECFREAQKDRFTKQADHDFLFSYIDTISTINMICAFIKDCVAVSNLFDLTKYLTDDEYIPDEVKDSWNALHFSLKSLQQIGENVFEKLEDHITFNATYYEHGSFAGKGKSRSPHRSCRLLWYKYPVMLSDFASYFGEDKDEPPKQLLGEMRNRWQRRRILTLQGNVYWGFFRTYSTAPVQSDRKDQLDRLTKIKKHLNAITEKDSKDMSNCVCVNVALGLLGCPNRLSDEDIYKMCRYIITLGKERVEIGHFFVMMLMWPTSNSNIPYNDDAFKDSLKFLSDKSKKSKRQMIQKPKTSFPKEGKTILSPSTQFFLTKLDGLRSICHRSDIFFKENHDSQTDRGTNFWDQPTIKETLKKLKGQLLFNDGIYILVENPHTPGKYFQIRKTRSGGREYNSEEEVTFYVGFSMAGPIAYDVKPLRYMYDHDVRNLPRQLSNIANYKNNDITELKKMQSRIRQIEQKRADRRNEREKKLLNDKEDIQTILDSKLGRGPSDFS